MATVARVRGALEMRRLCVPSFVVFALWISATTARAESWAGKMFDGLAHDFGTVARGAEVQHDFVITNPYKETVHISSIAKTCGCTTAKVDRDTLKSHEKAHLTVVMDTLKFTEKKSSTITVTFDRPYFAQVKVKVSAYIRRDVVLSPGCASFGPVDHGTKPTREISIAYAGRPDWRIEGVQNDSKFIETELTETRRSSARVDYKLVVALKPEAPVGYFRDRLTILTNDTSSPKLPLVVEGKVESDITVSPGSLSLGTVQAGKKVTRQVVVRGKKPFRILQVNPIGEEKNASFSVQLPGESKPLHLVAVTFEAPDQAGSAHQRFRIETDVEGGETVEFSVNARVAQ